MYQGTDSHNRTQPSPEALFDAPAILGHRPDPPQAQNHAQLHAQAADFAPETVLAAGFRLRVIFAPKRKIPAYLLLLAAGVFRAWGAT